MKRKDRIVWNNDSLGEQSEFVMDRSRKIPGQKLFIRQSGKSEIISVLVWI